MLIGLLKGAGGFMDCKPDFVYFFYNPRSRNPRKIKKIKIGLIELWKNIKLTYKQKIVEVKSFLREKIDFSCFFKSLFIRDFLLEKGILKRK